MTKSIPIVLAKISKQWTNNGNNIKEIYCSNEKLASAANCDPKIITEIISAEIDSNKSADYPAQSPTLSPTKSAITAGFLS